MPSPRPRLCIAAIALTLLAGCAGPGYYVQAIEGQLGVMRHTRTIDAILQDPATDAALKKRLAYVLKARTFASRELALPDNPSYRRYADLQGPYVTWSVIATPELSLQPVRWCFLVAGCVPYRGYFSQQRAQDFAARLQRDGDDVYVAGVSAYSTLGWFSDPLPSPVLRRSDVEVAGIIFHELAHQELYVRGDSAFNESFATTVEIEGVRRWLQAGTDTSATAPSDQARTLHAYLQDKQRHEEFVALLLKHRAQLQTLYASSLADAEKRTRKAQVFRDLKQDYQTLKLSWGGYAGYDHWFDLSLNNAHLSAVGLYQRYVPAFQALLAEQQGDLPRFYTLARKLSQLPAAERADRLHSLACEGQRGLRSTTAITRDPGC